MMYAIIVYLLHGGMSYIMEEASWWLFHKLSDLVALPHISVLVALPRLSVSGDSVTLSVLAAMLHISEACSGWVGRVVSPHGERMVWGCTWLVMGWVLHIHEISDLIYYGPMGLILYSILG